MQMLKVTKLLFFVICKSLICIFQAHGLLSDIHCSSDEDLEVVYLDVTPEKGLLGTHSNCIK